MKASFFAILITISTLQSAYCQTKDIDDYRDAKTSAKISRETAKNIFVNLVHIKPLNCIDTEVDKKECILCMADRKVIEYGPLDIAFYKLTKFANAWTVETEKPVFTDSFNYCEFYNDFEVTVINGKPYTYLLYMLSPEGNAVALDMYRFALYSLTDFQLTTLNYDLYTDAYSGNKDGKFTNIVEFANKLELRNYLESKASKSPYIYRPTAKELDLNDPDNYAKRWILDNPNISFVWSTNVDTNQKQIRTFYYNKDIHRDTPSQWSTVENNQYQIFYSSGELLGYEKFNKKYFPIWIEPCQHHYQDCNRNISFINNDTLKIEYPAGDLIVDLQKMSYRIKLFKSR